MRHAVLATALAVLPVALAAQTPAAAPSPAAAPAVSAPVAPEPPKPPVELQKLAFLVGDWVHDETFEPSPMGPGGKGKGRSKTAWTLGEHHLYVIYASNTPMGKYEARGFLGWDGEAKAYRMHWFDSMGMATSYTGTIAEEGALVMNTEYTFQGEKVREQLSIRKREDGSIDFSSFIAAPDGSLKRVMESIATTVPNKG